MENLFNEKHKQVGWGCYPNKNKLRKWLWVDTSPLPSPQGEGEVLKMKNIRQSNVNTHKDAWVEINLEYLAQNIIEIKKGIPKNKKMLGKQMLTDTVLK